MPRFLLSHAHHPDDCGIAFAAWRGFESPLRHGRVLATCSGEHEDGADHALVWTVDAETAGAALAQLPPWVAERSEAHEVGEVTVP
jgi:hypothetical protein